MRQVHGIALGMVVSLLLAVPGALHAAGPDLIVFNGKVVTVPKGPLLLHVQYHSMLNLSSKN